MSTPSRGRCRHRQQGPLYPGIPRGNFRVLEDNVPQQISGYNVGEAPLTVALVIEFSNKFQTLYGATWFQTLQLAYGFCSTLKPEDYVAVIAYDLKPEILSDFTTDRMQTNEALHRLTIPAWSRPISSTPSPIPPTVCPELKAARPSS